MKQPEVISSEKVYNGRVFDVFLDKIRDGDVEYERDVITHNGSAVIVPVFANKTVALVKQYRQPAQKYLYEIPAGSLDKNENPETGARRELEEEIGVTAGSIEKKRTKFLKSKSLRLSRRLK
jgi:ADP-ribose pyrophosphatase